MQGAQGEMSLLPKHPELPSLPLPTSPTRSPSPCGPQLLFPELPPALPASCHPTPHHSPWLHTPGFWPHRYPAPHSRPTVFNSTWKFYLVSRYCSLTLWNEHKIGGQDTRAQVLAPTFTSCVLLNGSLDFKTWFLHPKDWLIIFTLECDYEDKIAAAAAKLLQLYSTLGDPVDRSPPGSSIHGIFQARVPEWGAIAFPQDKIRCK